jgi:hypothetical protein
MRLTERVSDIHDGLLGLRGFLDPATGRAATAEALAAGAGDREARAVGDAAMVVAALRRKALVGQGDDAGQEQSAAVRGTVTSGFEEISRALRHSSIVGTHRVPVVRPAPAGRRDTPA